MAILILALVYTSGAWLFNFGRASVMAYRGQLSEAEYGAINAHMFKLGLCAILAAGFLYLGDKL